MKDQVKRGVAMRRASLSFRKMVAIVVSIAVVFVVSIAQHHEGAEQRSADDRKAVEAVVEKVVDGDTLDVKPAAGGETMRIRLIGIDAPESVNPDDSKNTEAGREASAWLKGSLPKGTSVWLVKDVSDTDKYGRYLRYVWVSDPSAANADPAKDMLNALIVANGHAVAKDFPPDTAYSQLFHSLES